MSGITEKADAAIYIAPDGSVHLDGMLIFHKKEVCVLNDCHVPNQHSITNNFFYFGTPKWYQIGQWIRLIRLIRNYT